MADNESTGPARWAQPSVRVRATGAAVLVFGLVLTIAALGALAAQRSALRAEVAGGAQARADAVAAAIEQAVEPSVLVQVRADELVQIISSDGTVQAASEELTGVPAIQAETWPRTLALRDDDPRRYEVQRAEITKGSLASGAVVVGRSLASTESSLAALRRSVAVGVPALTAIAGLITWVLVGGALRPVDRMRRQVEAISASRLDLRIADPGGHDEVARLAATMNTMLGRLQDSHRAQRRFVSDASHELRSPLAVLRQTAEVARCYPAQIDAAELAATTLAETDRMQRLVDSLLLLARSDEHRLEVHPSTFDVADLLRAEAARQLAEPADLADADVEGQDAPTSPVATIGLDCVTSARVSGDRALLAHAVRNLVDNARRHAASRVVLGSARTARGVRIWVEDDGPGIAEADRQRVFERFVRLDDSRARSDGGAGLGLAIVEEIASAHGGHVRVETSTLGGARFELTINSRQADDPHETCPQQSATLSRIERGVQRPDSAMGTP